MEIMQTSMSSQGRHSFCRQGVDMGDFEERQYSVQFGIQKNHTDSFMEDKYSQGEDSSLRRCVVIQVKCYDGFTKGSLFSDSEEHTIFRMASKVS